MPATPRNPKFFATPAAFREWLSRNHKDFPELWVGFHKKGSGKPSITWAESVDEALCFGWLDGLRKSLDAASERQFKTDRKAWAFFHAQPPWYRRTATWFVISAKQAETRKKRLARLIEDSAKGLTIRELRRPVRTS
jgi:uncharacterized protein YdeI (YjbR/CyaY-like superfamily)